MRKSNEELIKIISQGQVQKFVAYLNAKGEISETVKKAVFKSKNPGILKAYINNVFPAGSEFYNHQDLVARYANRKTLCTYYLYHRFDTIGQIELIKRGVIRIFSYYVGRSPKLTKEAFAFLVSEGKAQLVKYYLENCLEAEDVKDFIEFGNLKYIKYYTKIATASELDVVVTVVCNLEDKELKAQIIKECKVLRPWLFVNGEMC